jgi:hypothetical protein
MEETMRNTIAIVLALLFAVTVQAQTPAPLPAPNADVNVSVTTEYIHFTNGATGTMVEAVRPISDYWGLGYAQIMVPDAKSEFFLLGPRYDTDLQHIFKKSKPSKLDLSMIKVFGGAGLGTRRDSLGNNATLAFGAHAGFGIGVGTLMGAKVGFNVSAGFIGAAKQAPVGPRILAAFTEVANGQYAAGVTLTF